MCIEVEFCIDILYYILCIPIQLSCSLRGQCAPQWVNTLSRYLAHMSHTSLISFANSSHTTSIATTTTITTTIVICICVCICGGKQHRARIYQRIQISMWGSLKSILVATAGERSLGSVGEIFTIIMANIASCRRIVIQSGIASSVSTIKVQPYMAN